MKTASSLVQYKIYKGHTTKEYFNRFAKYYNQGKIYDFTKKEMWLMDKRRVYWEIVDSDGVTRYYQLPNRWRRLRHLNPDHQKNHKPIVVASIVAGLGLITVAVLATLNFTVFKKQPYVPPPEPVPEPIDDSLLGRYERCKKEGKNPVDEFTLTECAQIPILKFLKNEKYFTVGRGSTVSYPSIGPTVGVAIRNALIVNGGALEEAISVADNILAPTTANRDYQKESIVEKYFTDKVKNIESATYSSEPTKTFSSLEEYENKAGKAVGYPFLYTISDETILLESSTKPVPVVDASGVVTGYNIHLELDTELAVANHYVRRIEYIADGQVKVDHFEYINFDMTIDNDFNLIETNADEKYVVNKNIIIMTMQVPTVAKLKTRYYGTEHELIDTSTDFDYANYQF